MAKIFVIEDDKHILDLYSLELSELGHEIITAESRRRLLKKIEVYQPDIVILEIKLVDCDGLEMLQEIREYDNDLPVIICSAYESYRYDIRTIAADYFISKSCDLTELKSKIDRVLDTKIPFPDMAAM